jgi:hypothetical protein
MPDGFHRPIVSAKIQLAYTTKLCKIYPTFFVHVGAIHVDWGNI